MRDWARAVHANPTNGRNQATNGRNRGMSGIRDGHGFAGAGERWGFGGHVLAPITCDGDRGAPRLLPGRDERWGVWGPCRGPHLSWRAISWPPMSLIREI